jgi:hypothetical protein
LHLARRVAEKTVEQQDEVGALADRPAPATENLERVDVLGEHQTLWDMLKVAAAQRLPSVERGYLVVAATARSWAAGRRAGCRYFMADAGSARAKAAE